MISLTICRTGRDRAVLDGPQEARALLLVEAAQAVAVAHRERGDLEARDEHAQPDRVDLRRAREPVVEEERGVGLVDRRQDPLRGHDRVGHAGEDRRLARGDRLHRSLFAWASASCRTAVAAASASLRRDRGGGAGVQRGELLVVVHHGGEQLDALEVDLPDRVHHEREDEVAGGVDELGHEGPVEELRGGAVGGVDHALGGLRETGRGVVVAAFGGQPGGLAEHQRARLHQGVERAPLQPARLEEQVREDVEAAGRAPVRDAHGVAVADLDEAGAAPAA